MKTALGVLALVAFFAMSSAPASTSEASPPHPTPEKKFVQVAATCFLKGEQTSGMNKVCYYDCLGSIYAITIGAVELCPLSINR